MAVRGLLRRKANEHETTAATANTQTHTQKEGPTPYTVKAAATTAANNGKKNKKEIA